MRDDHSKVLDLVLVEIAFLQIEVVIVLLEFLQNLSRPVVVFVEVGGMYDHVDHVYAKPSFRNFLFENVIHHLLKYGGRVA